MSKSKHLSHLSACLFSYEIFVLSLNKKQLIGSVKKPLTGMSLCDPFKLGMIVCGMAENHLLYKRLTTDPPRNRKKTFWSILL